VGSRGCEGWRSQKKENGSETGDESGCGERRSRLGPKARDCTVYVFHDFTSSFLFEILGGSDSFFYTVVELQVVA